MTFTKAFTKGWWVRGYVVSGGKGLAKEVVEGYPAQPKILQRNTQTQNGDELYAFTLTILRIDSHLLIPSAFICILSGVMISTVEDLGMFSCSWVIAKSLGSITALFIGIFFMIPWMSLLSQIVDIKRIQALPSTAAVIECSYAKYNGFCTTFLLYPAPSYSNLPSTIELLLFHFMQVLSGAFVAV